MTVRPVPPRRSADPERAKRPDRPATTPDAADASDGRRRGAVPEAVSEQVFEAIHGLMHRYRSEQYRAMLAGGHSLSHLEGKVLGFFLRHPGATLKDVVEHSGRDKGQLARLVGGLKAAGLLEARPDESDRRSIRLSPSAAGREIQQRLATKATGLNDAAVAGLSPAELTQLLALLARVRANIDAVSEPDGGDGPTATSAGAGPTRR